MQHSQPCFTYGDKIRRKNGEKILLVIKNIGQDTYQFTNGSFALISDQDCYELVEKSSGFFLVSSNCSCAPLHEHLNHGYEEKSDFAQSIQRLIKRWGGRIGQYVSSRNGFINLKFCDNPGGITEKAWLPLYLLSPAPTPDYIKNRQQSPDDDLERIINEAFGFD